MAGCCGAVNFKKELVKDCCDPKNRFVPGSVITYKITLTNTSDASETVKLVDPAPTAGLAASTVVTKVITGGATGATSTSLPIADTVVMPSNSSVVYTIAVTTAAVPPVCPMVWTNVATISKGTGCSEEIHYLESETVVVAPANVCYDLDFVDSFGKGGRAHDASTLAALLFGQTNKAARAKIYDFVENGGTLASLLPV